MKKHFSKTILTASLMLLVIVVGQVMPMPSVQAASTKTDPGYQKIFDEQICPALERIPNQKLSGIWCRDYPLQKDLDNAYHKICDVHGAKGDKKISDECNAYADYKKGSFTPVSSDSSKVGCANNSCVDPAAQKDCKSNDGKCDFIGKYINPMITLLTTAFGVIAVISIIIGGIQYSASEGDPQKVTSAKTRIRNTIIAVVAYFFLYGFLQFLIPGGIFNRG